MIVIFSPSGKETFRPSRQHKVYKKGEVCDNIAEVLDQPSFVLSIDQIHKTLLFFFLFWCVVYCMQVFTCTYGDQRMKLGVFLDNPSPFYSNFIF